MPGKDRPKVAVAGCGYWGRNLVRDFYALGVLKWVLDDNPQTMKSILEDFPGLRAAPNLAAVLADNEVAGVVLATPAVSHYELGLEVLKSGRHLFVEKPLALSVEEGRRMVELAEERGLVLMVDHLLRQHPAYVALKNLADQGLLGRLTHLESIRRSFGKIRSEEDAWWSFAPHDISMLLGLMGRPPESVAAQGRNPLGHGRADLAYARLDFGGGAEAHISVSWLNPVKEQRLTVIGEKASAVFDDTLPGPEKLKIYRHRVDWPGQKPQAIKAEAEAIPTDEGRPLTAQAAAFIEALEGSPRPLTDGREGLGVLAVLQAGSDSMKNGGRPVPLAAGPGPDFFVHPTAEIDPGARIGRGCRIWHFSHILSGSEIGEDCNLGQNVVVGPRVTIGRGVKIQNNVSVYEGVTLEDEVFCGPSMVFTNVHNPRAHIVRKNEYRPTRVGRGAAIGANATVVCGHSLGPWCFIGAGAVVTDDVPAHALMVGNPARQTGWMCRCGLKLPQNLVCQGCGLSYRKTSGGLEEISGEGEK